MNTNYNNRPRNEAVERIEFYISHNNLPPYSRIPSERDMCGMWNINRTTLRSAIRRLINEGKLYNQMGSGTYVAPPRLIRNLQDLKSLTTFVSESGQALTSKVISSRVMECNKQVTLKLKLPLGSKVLELVRLRLVDGKPATIENCYLDLARFSGLEEHDFSKESLYAVLEEKYGVTMYSGSEKVGITYATEDEAKLLNIKPGQPLFFLSAVISDQQDVPVEYTKSVVRSDIMRFSSELIR